MADRIEAAVAAERASREIDQERDRPQSQRIPDDASLEDHPALQAMSKKMVSSHQRRMQELAAKERELDRQMQMLQSMQSNQQYAAGPRETAANDDFDWVEPELRPLVEDANQGTSMRALLKSIEKRVGRASAGSEVGELKETVKTLQQQLQQQHSALVQERYARQIPEFRKKYGNALDEDLGEQVLREAIGRGIDLDRALWAVSPDTALAQERKRWEAERDQEFRQQYGASLEGMEHIGEPRTDRSPIGKDGRLIPFEQSALDILGKGGMLNAMRNGFDSRSEAEHE